MGKILTWLAAAVVTLVPLGGVEAAALNVAATPAEAAGGQVVRLRVSVDSDGQSVNAVEGTLQLPDTLELLAVSDAGTAIDFWAVRPRLNGNTVPFSGIVPGGFTGTAKLFYVDVRVRPSAGERVEATFSGARVLLNDGAGTSAPLEVATATISISGNAPQPVVVVEAADHEPPEPFSPVIAELAGVGEGGYYMVFAAEDKGSGVDRYEVREGLGPFRPAESPYRLRRQGRDVPLLVRAYDRAGNYRDEPVAAQQPVAWHYAHARTLGILALLAILAAATSAIRRSRRKRKTEWKQ